MNVLDILNLMGTLSIGNDNITASEQAIFLQYLNLAHFELYQGTANLNQNLLIRENLSNEEGSNEIELSQMPFLVNSVYISSLKQKLTRLSMADVIERDPDLSETGSPEYYFVQNNIVQFYPVQTAIFPIVAWYTPNPSSFTIATLEADIPYPVSYHPVLADGGLYYLFQDAGGFKNIQKENEAKARWERGKSKLLSYLYNSSGQRFSTFRNA